MRSLSIFFLLLIALGVSCSKEDPVVVPPFLNAKADNVVKDCDVITVTLVAGMLQINARQTNGDAVFLLTVYNYETGQIGTFNIGPGNFNAAYYKEGSTSYAAGTSSGTGRIQITNSNSGGVQGSFEFTGVSATGASKIISDGRFSAYY